MNTFGRIYRLTDFGESHGPAMGGVIDGVPAGLRLDFDAIRRKLAARRPATSELVSLRHELDEVEFLSGLKDGVTLGTPIGFIVRNRDARSADYSALEHAFRPGHADYTYFLKYGIREARGGGRASARETVCRVVAGAVALQFLAAAGVEIRAFVSGIGEERMPSPYGMFPSQEEIDASPVRCPDSVWSARMEKVLRQVAGHDSIGARVSVICRGVPAGLGEPVAGKLQSMLAAAMMSINAVREFEFGLGMKASETTGSQADDFFTSASGQGASLRLASVTNHCGGILGGISTGADICFSIAFKPTPTLPQAMRSYDETGEEVTLPARGRHDPCVGIRGACVAEAMTAMVLLDGLLLARSSRWD